METAPDPEVATIGISQDAGVRGHRKRQPEVGQVARLHTPERRRRNAYDLKISGADGYLTADCGGAGAEVTLPEGVAQDGDGRTGSRIVFWLDQPSQGGLHAEDVKTATGDGFDANVFTDAWGVVEKRRLQAAGEVHRENVGIGAGGVAEKFILGIAERIRFARLIPRAEKRRHDSRDIE